MTRAICLGLALLGGLLSAANAEPPEGKGRQPFSVHDSNQDGFLDEQEYYCLRKAIVARRGPGRRGPPLLRFDQLDLDGNGLISESELVEGVGQGRQYRWYGGAAGR